MNSPEDGLFLGFSPRRVAYEEKEEEDVGERDSSFGGRNELSIYIEPATKRGRVEGERRSKEQMMLADAGIHWRLKVESDLYVPSRPLSSSTTCFFSRPPSHSLSFLLFSFTLVSCTLLLLGESDGGLGPRHREEQAGWNGTVVSISEDVYA